MINTLIKKKSGFSVVEVLIATLIILPVFVSVMMTFIKSMELNEISNNTSLAVWEVRSKLSEIENTPYAQIKANFDDVTFLVGGVNGIGVTYVDDSQPNVLQVSAAFSWRERNSRMMGEDADLDGQIDVGEDLNGNGMLDSPVFLSTAVYNL